MVFVFLQLLICVAVEQWFLTGGGGGVKVNKFHGWGEPFHALQHGKLDH